MPLIDIKQCNVKQWEFSQLYFYTHAFFKNSSDMVEMWRNFLFLNDLKKS